MALEASRVPHLILSRPVRLHRHVAREKVLLAFLAFRHGYSCNSRGGGAGAVNSIHATVDESPLMDVIQNQIGAVARKKIITLALSSSCPRQAFPLPS